jgi:hypothetical protein
MINRKYFVLKNYKTKEEYLCSWFENEPDYYGRKVHYIGKTNGLGGLNKMLEDGFVTRKNYHYYLTRTQEYLLFKRKKMSIEMYNKMFNENL